MSLTKAINVTYKNHICHLYTPYMPLAKALQVAYMAIYVAYMFHFLFRLREIHLTYMYHYMSHVRNVPIFTYVAYMSYMKLIFGTYIFDIYVDIYVALTHICHIYVILYMLHI
jgi:hypothetical protein